jgi:ribonucleoside-diphosphate reductase beta chain
MSKIITNTQLDTNELIRGRRVINSDPAGMLQMLPYKYTWAREFFETMYGNSWHPREVNLNEDASMWKDQHKLSPQEREIFSRSLSFVSNLDTLQTYSLSNAISKQITAPELLLLVIRQTFEETIHVLSYSNMIELLGINPNETYGRYRKDEFLKAKLDHIVESINKILEPDYKTGTFENDQLFLEALVNNVLLEGLFFYSSFLMFYGLARNGKMLNSSRIIGMINRDEATHRDLMIRIYLEICKEQPELVTEEFKARMLQKIKDAVELEAQWGVELLSTGDGTGMVGITKKDVTGYTQYLGDIIASRMGFGKIYNVENPCNWVTDYTDINNELGAFFETAVIRYSQEVPETETASMDW